MSDVTSDVACAVTSDVTFLAAGKVSVAVMAAQLMFSSTMWCNAYFADMERVETGVECAFQFMAAFAVPAETSDTCALMAFLSRWSSLPMGLIVHLPPEMTPRLLKHISHNVEKLCKASCPFRFVCSLCFCLVKRPS